MSADEATLRRQLEGRIDRLEATGVMTFIVAEAVLTFWPLALVPAGAATATVWSLSRGTHHLGELARRLLTDRVR